MTVTAPHPFMGKVFVGAPCALFTSHARYAPILAPGETVEMEFKGVRDAMIFTDRRMIVINAQGLKGKKVELTSFLWRAVTAFSVENSGTFDLDAEFKFCGSGWGVCEVSLTRGTDIAAVATYINYRVLG